MDERGDMWNRVCRLDKINCETGMQIRVRTDLTCITLVQPECGRHFPPLLHVNPDRAGYGGSPEAWIVIERRNTKSQNGG